MHVYLIAAPCVRDIYVPLSRLQSNMDPQDVSQYIPLVIGSLIPLHVVRECSEALCCIALVLTNIAVAGLTWLHDYCESLTYLPSAARFYRGRSCYLGRRGETPAFKCPLPLTSPRQIRYIWVGRTIP